MDSYLHILYNSCRLLEHLLVTQKKCESSRGGFRLHDKDIGDRSFWCLSCCAAGQPTRWNEWIVCIVSCSVVSDSFAAPWTAACQASLSFIVSWSLLKFMSIESVMPSSHLILCRPLLLLPSIFPSITLFSNESVLHIRWPKSWSFSLNISPSNEYSGLISFRMD